MSRLNFILLTIIALLCVAGPVGYFVLKNNDSGMSMGIGKEKRLKVFLSMPLMYSLSESIMNATILAFEEAGGMAGPYKVDLIIKEDGDVTGKWIAEKEKLIAEVAAADPHVVAYIGPINSGAAKIAIPILNQAGIAEVGITNSWPGLTKPGYAPGEPGNFYPTGIRTFFRMVASDEVQGPAGAIWADSMGFKSVYILDDGEAYGKGVADIFDAHYAKLGAKVLGHETVDKKAKEFTELARKIIKTNPDLVYFGAVTPNGAIPLIRDLRTEGYKGAIMGPHGLWDPNIIKELGALAEGLYATNPNTPETMDTEKVRQFNEAYEARFGQPSGFPGPTAYAAANMILEAIAKSDGTKKGVLEAVRATNKLDTLVGGISFDENGDINHQTIFAGQVVGGKFEFVKILN